MIKKKEKPAASVKPSRFDKKSVAKNPSSVQPGKKPSGFRKGFWRFVIIPVVLLVLIAFVGAASFWGYREYRSVTERLASLESLKDTLKDTLEDTLDGIRREMQTEQALLNAEIKLFEKRLLDAERKNAEQFKRFESALNRLGTDDNSLLRLETFVYQAERERLIGRSPRSVRDLLLRAEVTLKDMPQYPALADALGHDLTIYDALVEKGEANRIFYKLRALANETSGLPAEFLLPETDSHYNAADEKDGGWYRQWVALFDRYIRIYRYDKDEKEELAYTSEKSSRKLVKLLLETDLILAERALLAGESQPYRESLSRYLIKLKHYYPPSSTRLRLEGDVQNLMSVDFPKLPELNIVRILPRYR